MLGFAWMIAGWSAVATAGDWPDLSHPPKGNGKDGRADAAVLIGIEDYARVDDVPGARANIEDWYRWLAKTRGVPLSRIHRLEDGQAVDHKIRSEVEKAAAEVQAGGTLWFVFVGHGAPAEDGKDGLLVGADADRSADGIYQRSVSRDELSDLMGRGKQAETVMVLDACFSGQGHDGDSLVEGLQPLMPNYTPDTGNLTMMTAADSGQFAGPLHGSARPAFSYLVLGALRGWGDADEDGKVTAKEATEYAKGALVATARDRNQSPVHHGPDAVLAVSAREQGPDLVELALAAPPSTSVGGVKIETGGDVDFARLAQEAAAAEAAERAAKERAEQLRRKVDQERQARMRTASDKLKAKASADWKALAGLRDTGGERAEGIVQKYIDTYATARVTVDDVARAVVVPEVDEARLWLAQARESAAADPLAEPIVAAGTDLDVRSKVMKYWRQCSSLSDVSGCANLGFRYERGLDGVDQDHAKAAALYRRGCQHNSGVSCSNLGVTYSQGIGVEKDLPTAVSWYRAACDLDWGRGCGYLGVKLGAGQGVTKNLEESLGMLRRGCDLDDGYSCRLLGNRYHKGNLGAPMDASIARGYLDKACELDEEKACATLTESFGGQGQSVGAGLGTDGLDSPRFTAGVSKESREKVLGYWRKCMDGTDFDACNSLGYRYELAKDGLVKDLGKAAQLYLMACNQGIAMGCGNVGYFYESGRAVPKDARQAIALYTKGCDGGNGRSCGNMGLMYDNGEGTRTDKPRANKLYERGCELGSGASCTNLGYNYEKGEGIGQSAKSALRYYELGCDKGSARGCGNLGYMLWEGESRYQDHTRARKYLKMACDDDNARSCNNFAIMAGSGVGGTTDYALSNRYMKKGCDGGDANACRNLALRYFDGTRGQTQSTSTARKYFQKSCELGNDDACNDLRTRY